ncbi:hypothetical protein ACHAXS_002978 [Conticribra weissflogii]
MTDSKTQAASSASTTRSDSGRSTIRPASAVSAAEMPRLSMLGHELGSDAAPFPLCGRERIEEDDWELERRSQ